jgi:hypothetical protein
MKQAEKTLEKIYERDNATGAFIMSVATDKYGAIFNDLDPEKRLESK